MVSGVCSKPCTDFAAALYLVLMSSCTISPKKVILSTFLLNANTLQVDSTRFMATPVAMEVSNSQQKAPPSELDKRTGRIADPNNGVYS